MRKVTREITAAFLAGEPRAISNTTTDGTAIYLHGNKIAWWSDRASGVVSVTLAGWPSSTTRQRLNGIPGISAWQGKGEQYINGHRVGSRDIVEVNIAAEAMKSALRVDI